MSFLRALQMWENIFRIGPTEIPAVSIDVTVELIIYYLMGKILRV